MCFQEHNLDWFPRMRAMSLVSSDADGEQNEIRNLQEKLESTMKLVSNLSGQLTELKEQVGRTERHECQRSPAKYEECVCPHVVEIAWEFATRCPLDAEHDKGDES